MSAKAEPRGLSIRAYARWRRERGLPGQSPQAVCEALRTGRIERNRDGKITPETADRDWLDRTTRSPGGGGPSGAASLVERQIEKQSLEVALRRNRLEREAGQTVDLAELRPRLSEIHRTLRDQLLAVGQRVAADVLALEDMGSVAAAIETAIRAELEAFVAERGANS